MIILAMAIYCEAKPLIEKYRLKKDESYMPFTVFANEEKEILLIITGTGNAAAASSVAGVCAKLDLKADKNFLVNIGTCASASASDEIYICSKITDESSERTFYPDMIYKNPFKEAEIITSAVLFENKSKSLKKYHIFFHSTKFDNFFAKNNQDKKHLHFGSAFCPDKISVYCAFSAVVSVTTVVSAASSPVASAAVVTAAVPVS